MSHYTKILTIVIVAVLVSLVGCGGTHHYKLQNVQDISIEKQLPGNLSLTVSSESIYHHALGYHTYELYVKEAVEKQFSDTLKKCFSQGLVESKGDTHIAITALDTSVFPISTVITDVRLFFRVEIFDKQMQLQKTTTIYGFGSNPDGNIALEKAVANAVRQLLPTLGELLVRQ